MTAENTGGGPGLTFAVLGPLEVRRDGAPLALGGRQQRAVLALLLSEAGHAVSIGRIANALWGEEVPASYSATVQTYVFHLRAVLEPDRPRGSAGQVLMTEPGGNYRLNVSDHSVDALLFEDCVRRGRASLEQGDAAESVTLLTQGLDLWRGDVLADLADFDFVTPVAARLHDLRLSTLEARIEADLALGHHSAAASELDRLVADDPLRERFHAQRMLALYRSDRQSDALKAYRDLRAVLQEELGVEPSHSVRELHSRVLAQDPALDWTPAVVGTDLALSNGPPPGTGQSQPPQPLLASPGGGRGVLGRLHRPWSRRAIAAVAALVVLAASGITAAVIGLSQSPGAVQLVANSIGAVRPDGSIAAAVTVGTDPVAVAYGAGALWVVNRTEGEVSRIDPNTHAVVRVIDVGVVPESLTVTAHDVWVANFADDTVSRINIDANRVVTNIPVGTGPSAIASGRSGVWVANSGDNTIERIDPVSGLTSTPIDVGAGPDGIAVDGKTLWVADGGDGTVLHLDATTHAQMYAPIQVGSGPKGIAISATDVWIANQASQSVTKIDRHTMGTATVPVGDGPSSAAYANGYVWVSEEYSGVLDRIDPASGATRRLAVGVSPRGLAAAGNRIWVAAGAFSAAGHRGGTLTIATDIPGIIDPAFAYITRDTRVIRLVYDGLVTQRFAAGADSQVLVPDLAVAIPRPSDGGRTYVFTLRSGIKYSTGREVQASDFVEGVRRALAAFGGNPAYYAGIVGGQHCIGKPKSCDLSRGVVTDNVARRVTFHLTAADPEFLYKLRWFVYPVPAGNTADPKVTPLPGTGPYRISEYTPDKALVLSRNTFFHPWSFAAQPDGYPDVIRWLKATGVRAATDAVTGGRADFTLLSLGESNDPATLRSVTDELKTRYPAQLHRDLTTFTLFITLDTRVPPFNNLEARRALSYALDRNTMVDLYGGPAYAVPTCQLLPPTFPGYAWDCPYTKPPNDGRYHGPDWAEAKRLVLASGTAGMTVTIHRFEGGKPIVEAYLMQVLTKLGYRAKLHQVPLIPRNYQYISPRNHLQVVVQGQGWGPDFPLASNFFVPLLSCGTQITPSEYCNRDLDQRMARATAQEGVDPAGAIRAWTPIDRFATDQVPLVPYVNNVTWTLVSSRVHDYQSSPDWGPLLSQLWVK